MLNAMERDEKFLLSQAVKQKDQADKGNQFAAGAVWAFQIAAEIMETTRQAWEEEVR
jgi:hypothetical protein